jgi:glutamate formiminotransferase/formiminotetrahydrofolate cyclodeaminase
MTIAAFTAEVASPSPTPGGGGVAAHAASLAAALAQMVAGVTLGRKKYVAVEDEMGRIVRRAAQLSEALATLVDRDVEAYSAVTAAYRLPKGTETEVAARAAAVTNALLSATAVPLDVARLSVDVCELAAALAAKGNANAVSEAGVAALLAEAACCAAAYSVRINVAALADRSLGTPQVAEAADLVRRASEMAATALDQLERAIEG